MNKSIFQSQTIWGVIMALVFTIMNVSGKHIPIPAGIADAKAVEFFQSLLAIAGAVMAIWGRIKAEVSLNNRTKKWYKSKTIQGVGLAIILTVLHYFGINIPLNDLLGVKADDQTLGLGNNVLSSLTLLYGLIGRIKADTKLVV